MYKVNLSKVYVQSNGLKKPLGSLMPRLHEGSVSSSGYMPGGNAMYKGLLRLLENVH